MQEPARGDTRPCTCPGCTGTMRYGRESDNAAPTAGSLASALITRDDKGWVCSKDPDHFSRAA